MPFARAIRFLTPPNMNVELEDDGKNGKFFIAENGKELAQMTFTWAGADKFIIDHTEVDESLRGQGAGMKMLLAAVERARTKQKKIVPLCPFAKNMFYKHKELRDVL